MTRRNLLATAELALTASALTAAVYVLGDAAYRPGSVRWTPIAAAGCLTALSFVALAAVLFVGRAALLLSADAVRARRWRREAPPSSARHRPQPGAGSRPAAPVDGRHARAMAVSVAAQLPQTLPMPALDDTVVMAPVGAS